jgi:hypothetical protein
VCTATDDPLHLGVGIGLANPLTDASFSLSTSVPAGTQSAAAVTGTKNLCDKLGNCVTVGPYSYKIDKQGPAITITSPTATTYQLGQVPSAVYNCSDAGSGVAAQNGCVATALDTTAGTHTFTVNALDAVGNPSSKSVTYTVSPAYTVKLLYDPTAPQSKTGTVGIKLELLDGSGNNVSGTGLTLTAKYIDNPGEPPSPNSQGGSGGSDGFTFRYTSPGYIYNLNPTTPQQLSGGLHTLYFIVNGAPSPLYTAAFTLKN